MFDASFEERVPQVIDERVPKIINEIVPQIVESKITAAIDQLKMEIGQFSLETTKRIDDLDRKLSGKIDDLSEKLIETTEMADTNRIEIAKVKRHLGLV